MAATRLLMLVLLLALAAFAGVWGQEEEAAAAAVDAQGEPEVAAGKGGKGRGIFGRMARMLDTGVWDDDYQYMTDAEWEATKDEGEPVDLSRPGVAVADLPDAWGTDRVLQMVQSTVDGNPTSAFKDMITTTRDLKDAWTNPVVFKYILSQFPLFQVIKPLQVLARKDQSQVTAADVSTD